MRRGLLTIASVTVFVIALLIANANPEALRGDSGENLLAVPTIFVVLEAGLLVLGIFCASFHQRMRQYSDAGTTQINIGADIRKMFGSTAFWLAMSAAPVIFCIIVKLTEGMSILASCIVAFQNGFFWQKVMPTAERKVEATSYSAQSSPSPTSENGAQ